MRIVLDHSIILSAILKKDPASSVLLEIEGSEKYQIIQTEKTFIDLKRELNSPSYKKLMTDENFSINDFLNKMNSMCTFYDMKLQNLPKLDERFYHLDESTKNLVALTLHAQADCMITDNEYLLERGIYGNATFISADFFLEILYTEKREHVRYKLREEVSGYFQLKADENNPEKKSASFKLYDISLGGFNLLSSYLPQAKTQYDIFIQSNGEYEKFTVEIVYSRMLSFAIIGNQYFQDNPVYSIGCKLIGCKLIDIDDNQKNIINRIIQTKCHDN